MMPDVRHILKIREPLRLLNTYKNETLCMV